MSAPNKVYPGPLDTVSHEPADNCIEYIRFDLVDELKGYTRHSVGCSAYRADSDKPCDCGLSETLRKLEE